MTVKCPRCKSENVFHISKWMAQCNVCRNQFEKVEGYGTIPKQTER